METGTSSESKQRQGLGEASGNTVNATPPPSKSVEAGSVGKENANAAARPAAAEVGGAGLETSAAEEVGQRLPSTQELVSMSGAERAARWKRLEYAQPDGGDGSGGATTTSTDPIDATAAAEATTATTRPAAAASPSAQAADVPAASAPASTHVAAEAGSIRWCLRTLSAMQERDKATRKTAGATNLRHS